MTPTEQQVCRYLTSLPHWDRSRAIKVIRAVQMESVATGIEMGREEERNSRLGTERVNRRIEAQS